MFARRFQGLADILGGMNLPEARLLAVGLAVRLDGILRGPAPRAVRVRACVDFYYSQAAVVHHRRADGAPTAAERVRRATWRPIGPGLVHARVTGVTDQGPIVVNLLRSERERIAAVDCRDFDRSLDAAARAAGASAATSGGFFLYSEADIAPPSRRSDPVGGLVSDGVIRSVPAFRRASLVQRLGARPTIEVVGPIGLRLEWSGGSAVVEAVNATGTCVAAYNRAWGAVSPADGRTALTVVGASVVHIGVAPVAIPLNGLVIHLDEHPAGAVRIALGDPTITDLMAGGPTLVCSHNPTFDLAAEDFAHSAPPITFSRDETFDQNLLPRMVVGQTPEGALIFAAIEGRSFDESPGFTLRQSAALLSALGCRRAMNLDGGSSKRMWVDGEIVDRPSTELRRDSSTPTEIRPVHSAVLLLPGASP